jgi:hypothetical protein
VTSRLSLFLTALAGVALAGCGEPGTPRLSNLHLDGQAPDSPLVLLLSLDFADDDADLSDGVLDTFINNEPTSAGPLPLLPIFVGSDVDTAATAGHLEFVLELSFADPAPPSGSTFTLGARATDAADRTSTTQEVRLQLEY